MTRSVPSADYSGKLSIGRSCLCFTRWSRPCQATFLMSETSPVLQIERRGGKVEQVSLADAALCPKPTTSCSCSGNGDQKIVMKLPGGRKLLLKASSAEEREEWRLRLEAAMLLPLLEKKGISAASLSAAVVDAGEKEEVSVDAKVFREETSNEPERLPVVNLPEEKGEVSYKEIRPSKGGEPVEPTDAYALSEGHTTWERIKENPEGSALASEGAQNAPEAALLSKNMSREVNSPDCEEEAPFESDAITLSKDAEGPVGGAPSWMGLIRRGGVLEPDMMDFNYDEMFQEAAEMDENIVPRRSALINSILRQLIQTMNPSKVPIDLKYIAIEKHIVQFG